jgi:exodeoxyribonuclease V alpha subunit
MSGADTRERTPAQLETLLAQGVLSAIDVHFARTMARLASERDMSVELAAALASRQVQHGHVCLELARLCRGELAIEAEGTVAAAIEWPALEPWLAALRRSALIGDARATTPLVLDASARLYLRRYFEHEHGLLQALATRVTTAAAVDLGVLRAGLDRLFGASSGPPAQPSPASAGKPARARNADRQLDLFAQANPVEATNAEPDLQRVAAERAVLRDFAVISGGPGTGKTSTVVKILALLVEQARARGSQPPRMHLLAPTGKAAARLSEAIKRAKATLAAEPEVCAAIVENASTIHRALGATGIGGQRFRHDREAPLATDVVVVDEASMVDLALMARLIDAVPARARMILLGDKNQLASVEAGAVLGDLCGAGLSPLPSAPMAGCIVHLTRSYRYAQDSGIRKLADAIQAAQAQRALELLCDARLPDITLIDDGQGDALPEALLRAAVQGFASFFDAQEAGEKLRALERFRVLCAHRRGPFGQTAVNLAIEAALRNAGLVAGRAERYAGRPILITQNDYQARLFNGDVGVLLADTREPERLRAHFAAEDGRTRDIAAARLPPHESVYAMSVHKSQGSEFDEVAVVLPPEASPVLSRELLYTAVTRARTRVVVYAKRAVLEHCVLKAVQRASGLRDLLWRV